MTKPLKFAALLASIWVAAQLGSTVMAADSGPQPSKSVVKQLAAASDAIKAGKMDEALTHISEAKSAPGEKTAYDTWVINSLTLQVYQKRGDQAGMLATLPAMAESQYASPEAVKVWYKALAQTTFQQKDYAKSLEYSEQAIKHGNNDLDTNTLVAKNQYLLMKYKEAAATMQDIVAKTDKPDEDTLKLLWTFNIKADGPESASAAKAIEKLVAFYPKPEYWANALVPLTRMDIKDEHLKLDVYRLENDVGVLSRGDQYAEMAEDALDLGYPGETQNALQIAFGKNLFTEQRDKDRYQHLLDGAKQKASADQASLPKQEQDASNAATGDALVQVGAAYLSYGQNDKAASAIQRGIAKGGLKSSDEATLLLGIAQLRMKSVADAQKSFDKVSTSANMGYARLGRLWALHAGAHNA